MWKPKSSGNRGYIHLLPLYGNTVYPCLKPSFIKFSASLPDAQHQCLSLQEVVPHGLGVTVLDCTTCQQSSLWKAASESVTECTGSHMLTQIDEFMYLWVLLMSEWGLVLDCCCAWQLLIYQLIKILTLIDCHIFVFVSHPSLSLNYTTFGWWLKENDWRKLCRRAEHSGVLTIGNLYHAGAHWTSKLHFDSLVRSFTKLYLGPLADFDWTCDC